MKIEAKAALRQFLLESLQERGDHSVLADSDSLFVSGRLDSFCMTQLILYLEEAFRIDFAEVDFDLELIDSVEEIERLIDSRIAV